MTLTVRQTAASVAVFMLTACSGGNGNPPAETKSDPTGTYREYLSEIRGQKDLSAESLTLQLRQWRTLKDSLFSCIRQDTTRSPHSDTRETCGQLHDSLRMEFSRLALSRQRTYKELLILKEQLSPYTEDKELYRSAETIRPYFISLDTYPARRGDKRQILSAYRSFLSQTLHSGIHGRDALERFIRQEDALFRAFLTRLNDYDDVNVSDITRDTEKCCSQVFLAAERNEISYREAMIYMAMRTDRRLIQNVRACLDNIRQQKIKTPEQARAYIWMLLQPYASLNGFCLTLLSPREKETLYAMAAETPGAFRTLGKLLQAEKNRLDELPGMLMEIFIRTL